MELLVKRKANLHAKNSKQQTPLDIAKNASIRQLLQQLQAAQSQHSAAGPSAISDSVSHPAADAGRASGQLPGETAASPAASPAASAQPLAGPHTLAEDAETAELGGDAASVAEQHTSQAHIGPAPRPEQSAAPAMESEANQGPIGPMLPPGLGLASEVSDEPEQEADQGPIGPMLPPGVGLASETSDSFKQAVDEAQPGSRMQPALEPSAGNAGKHAAMPGKSSSQPALHARRKRQEPEAEDAEPPESRPASIKKARVSLAHLGDEEED